ncbi:MAG TPA: alpha/beta hydrolase [Opitutaceae bacterium]|nr:alpha/beta hydrolase [Opitutaceae bacterium]
MSRWIFLALAVLLFALGLLNAVPSPAALPWKFAVVANSYGHWLAALAVLVAVGTWLTRGNSRGWARGGVIVAGLAAGLLARPAVQARWLARRLPAELTQAFGPVTLSRTPFSFADLFGGAAPAANVSTRVFADGLALDFYAPSAASPLGRTPPPCVVVVHGGGWDSGDKTELAHFDRWLASRGYAVAAISYRLAPQFPWPAPRDDTLAAIAFLKAHAGELGFDPARLVLLGRSAGGQIAETVAYTAHDPAIRGVVALYAPSDLAFAYAHASENDAIHSPQLMRQYLGGTPESAAANYRSASALNFVMENSPPTLLLHGQLDVLVWHRHSERLAAALAAHRVPHAFVSLPWATHAFEFNLASPGGQLTTFAIEWFLAAATR